MDDEGEKERGNDYPESPSFMVWAGWRCLETAYSEATVVILNSACALLLGESDLLQGVGGHGWRLGDEWRFGAVAILISNEANFSEGAVREGEPVGRE